MKPIQLTFKVTGMTVETSKLRDASLFEIPVAVIVPVSLVSATVILIGYGGNRNGREDFPNLNAIIFSQSK